MNDKKKILPKQESQTTTQPTIIQARILPITETSQVTYNQFQNVSNYQQTTSIAIVKQETQAKLAGHCSGISAVTGMVDGNNGPSFASLIKPSSSVTKDTPTSCGKKNT